MPKRTLRNIDQLSDFELFTLLNDAVAAVYPDDSCKAGVVTSTVRHDPPLYYVSIARYPGHVKQVVVKATADSMTKALREATREWLKQVMGPPKEQLLNKLASCVSNEEQVVIRAAHKRRR